MTLPQIIGATGRAGAGKDTFCAMAHDLLLANSIPSAIVACANPLKDMCADVFGTAYGVESRHFFGTQEEKQMSLHHYDLPNWSGRKILQYVGTEGFRHVGPQVWSNYMLGNAQKLIKAGVAVVLVSDIRFLSEAEAVQNNGGIVVRMKRPEADLEGENQGIAGHASETELMAIAEDFVLDNQGGPLESLNEKIRVLLCQLGFLPSTRKPQA